jgi:hypothetical protein
MADKSKTSVSTPKASANVVQIIDRTVKGSSLKATEFELSDHAAKALIVSAESLKKAL